MAYRARSHWGRQALRWFERTSDVMLPKSSQRVAAVIKIANDIAREYEQEYVGTDGLVLHPVTFSDLSNPKCYAPIEAYAPIEVVLDLRP